LGSVRHCQRQAGFPEDNRMTPPTAPVDSFGSACSLPRPNRTPNPWVPA